MVGNSGQRNSNFLLDIGRWRTYVEHVDLNLRLIGLGGVYRRLLRPCREGQPKETGADKYPGSHATSFHPRILSEPPHSSECTAGFSLISPGLPTYTRQLRPIMTHGKSYPCIWNAPVTRG